MTEDGTGKLLYIVWVLRNRVLKAVPLRALPAGDLMPPADWRRAPLEGHHASLRPTLRYISGSRVMRV